jgi:phosphoadenosine phosphosulfate reductase
MRTALQFSGGKDSLACLHLYREQWPDLLVMWLNTGAVYPEMMDYMDGWRSSGSVAARPVAEAGALLD